MSRYDGGVSFRRYVFIDLAAACYNTLSSTTKDDTPPSSSALALMPPKQAYEPARAIPSSCLR